MPEDYPRPVSTAVDSDAETTIGRAARAALEARGAVPDSARTAAGLAPDTTEAGLLLLENGVDALEARLVLADAAERALDVQYYIFHEDLTGRIVLDRLLRAADRGVRVRLLLDDLYVQGSDARFATLAAHPNVDVRLFNPFAGRSGLARFWSAVSTFGRVNRRMHNKTFIADNQVAILGGRNIGDEYFDAKPVMNFADLDVLVVGPVVADVSASFDAYWNDSLAVPVAALHGRPVEAEWLERLRGEYEGAIRAPQARPFLERLEASPLRAQIDAADVGLTWAPVAYVWDGPGKARAGADDAFNQVGPVLRALADSARAEALFVSPYFVPRPGGVDFFERLVARGVRTRVLTNSLAATDVPLVHAGYVRYRRPLIRAGVELFEFEPDAENAWAPSGRALLGSTQASLHAKAYVFDRERLFVSSYNLDPRSDRYNTEVGLVIESPALAAASAAAFDSLTAPGEAMRVVFAREADACAHGLTRRALGWLSADERGTLVCHGREPHVGLWKRLYIAVLSLIVPDRLL